MDGCRNAASAAGLLKQLGIQPRRAKERSQWRIRWLGAGDIEIIIFHVDVSLAVGEVHFVEKRSR
jgi:hypothetical protein